MSLKDGYRRREVLRSSLLLAALPPLCCSTPEVPKESVRFEGATVRLSLRLAPQLKNPGGSAALVEPDRGINLLVAHVTKGSYAAIDRTCTHGGAMCAYNERHRTLQCTSLNHAEYDLKGTLLHGRAHGNLKSYAVRIDGGDLLISLNEVLS